MVRFIISYNGEHLKTYELNDTSITVGRLPENTISIANMGISRRHFRVEADSSNNYLLTDLNSLNGTFVNNTKVSTTVLSTGDIISIGKYNIRFERVENASPAPTPTPVPVTGNTESKMIVEPALAEGPAASEDPKMRETADADEEILDEVSDEHVSAQPAKDTVTDLLSGTPVLIETNKHVVYKLDKPSFSIGSSENDDIFVNGLFIDEGHVIIEKKDNGIWISSKKLMGKFRVNSRKTKSHLLEHKDRIEIGNSTFRYMENE